MRKLSSTILCVIAGFFFYMVSILGFVNEPTAGAKWGIVLGFSIPALVFLCGGLALGRFRNWKRSTGIVLLASSGVTAFMIFTVACLFIDEEFRKMVRPDTAAFFSDYPTGFAVLAGLAISGFLLLKTHDGRAEQGTPADA